MSRNRDRAKEAHRLADVGWPVFPCRPGSKRPIPEHGFLEATTSHRQIEQWWRAEPRSNLAIATGAPGPDVVDVDRHKDGDGFAAWNKLKEAGLTGEPMAVVRTPSGGFHCYYVGTEQRNGHLPGVYVDFRSQGGYVVAPQSRIAQREYVLARHQASADTFDWAAAKQVLAPAPQRQPYRAPQRGEAEPKDVRHLAGWVAGLQEHNRNNGLFWAACRAAEVGDSGTLTELANAARATGLDDGEIGRTITSAQRTASQAPATRSFEHSQPSMADAAVDQPHPQAEAGALPARPASGPATALQRPAGP